MAPTSQFKIERHDTVGAPAAEHDDDFLRTCFINTGDYDVLRLTGDPRRILVGRTGSGKSALLQKLADDEDRVIVIRPSELALQYLSNHGLLRFFEERGIKMDLFYRLLWRHILTVELIKARYDPNGTLSTQQSWWTKLTDMISGGDSAKRRSLAYLEEWGESIWRDTEYRVREIVSHFQRKVQAGINVDLNTIIQAGFGASAASSHEQTTEVQQHGQEIINSLQIRRLSDVMDVLASDVFNDSQKPFYITIDSLDTDWVDDRLRYKLLRALIEAVDDFRRVRNVKIIIALRRDLIERVFCNTRDSGFQEEKYDGLMLDLRWDQDELLRLLDARVNQLVTRRYTRHPLSHTDLLPDAVRKIPIGAYLTSRTLYRPRDVIMFFNVCLDEGRDQTRLNVRRLMAAELKYSETRFRALGDEWHTDYPNLLDFAVALLAGREPSFLLSELSWEEWANLLLKYAAYPPTISGLLLQWAVEMHSGTLEYDQGIGRIFQVFHDTGLIGLRTDPTQGIAWTFQGRRKAPLSEITGSTRVHICPAFYRVLGTRTVEIPE